MTYPRIWLGLAWLGVTESHSTLIGVSLMTAFFASVLLFIGPISARVALYYAAVLCSPSIMMAVETGNNDLVIFLLVMLAAFVLRRSDVAIEWVATYLVLFAAALKYYPVAAFVFLLRRSRSRALMTGVPIALVFAGYLWWTRTDLVVIQQLVQRSTYLSFGGMVMFEALRAWTASSIEVPAGFFRILYIVVATIVAGCAVATGPLWRFEVQADSKLDAFRMGAAIYLTSFVLWSNWDYRFIFLLLTIPQMIAWLGPATNGRRHTRIAVVVLAATLWLSSGAPPGDDYTMIRTFVVDELLNWYLFYFYVAALVATSPAWALPRIVERRSLR
jgi:hypothetical protein